MKKQQAGEQLVFDLPVLTSMGRDDFFVSEANARAVRLVEDWRLWPDSRLFLTGEKGSGKTHLSHVFSEQSAGQLIKAVRLAEGGVRPEPDQPLALDDVDQIAGRPEAEEALFHLINRFGNAGQFLLMSGRQAPGHWPLQLKDLKSRLMGTMLVNLEPPDDALLGARLVKFFADRQTVIDPAVIRFAIRHAERSFANLLEFAERLDQAALARKRPVTVPLARAVLDKM